MLLILVLVGGTLLVLLWAGTLFMQGYFYTDATAQIYWQAPASAAVLTLFLFLWCFLNASSADARPEALPYNTIFALNVEEPMTPKPVEKLWAVTKSGKVIPYKRVTKLSNYGGKSTDAYVVDREGPGQPYRGSGVVALEIEENKEKIRFNLAPTERGDYRRFVDNRGWVILELDDEPTGQPTKFHWGLLIVNLFLNFLHLGLWFVCLWLLLRFQWSHALGIGFVLWLIMTLAVLPMVLRESGAVAQARAREQKTASIVSPLAASLRRVRETSPHFDASTCMMSPSWTM
jgi:hypothetical protein